MSVRRKLLKTAVKKRRFRLSATQIIAIGFAAIILLGAGLLTLPSASRSGVSCGFFPALFTATSATCVTGLVMYDTFSQWSTFGHVVIISLIEIGGLGFMSAASTVVFLLRRKVGMRQKMLIAQALNLNDMDGVVKIQKLVLTGSLTIQAAGALILLLRFWPEFGFGRALAWGVFHSISAFCNAGFDLFGYIAPGQSLIVFNDDPIVCLTLITLVTVGGLGFLVWEEIASVRTFKKFSVYTKLVLLMTAGILLVGTVVILALEWNNPATIGNMPVWQKLMNAFFQTGTLRTAGFATVDQLALRDSTKVFSILIMFIGGSSGSTAGGLKTVTVLVLLLFVWAKARGKESVHVFKRNIPQEKAVDAMSIVFITVLLSIFGGMVISTAASVSFLDAWYEAVSAICTVGLSAVGTSGLGVVSQSVIIAFMYFGRVGILTLSLGFLMGNKAKDRFQYADTNLLIG
ncbi:MAG: potassium uptake protein, TrkH family [Oscillospiraceae bacterium]|nr:potassium uptake protein, TrkH family [Oscillospiraceae bacterium]